MVAAPFYTSEIFWMAAAVVVALVVGVGTVWIGWRGSNPKRGLRFGAEAIPLLEPMEGARTAIEVRYSGRAVDDAHLVKLTLINTGRRDIPSTAFDQDAPLRLNTTVPLLEVLDIKTQPATAAPPDVTIDGTELRIGPSRIGRRQRIHIVALAEGTPRCSLVHALVDVAVEEDTPEFRRKKEQIRTTYVITLFTAAAAMNGFLILNILNRPR
jgi:hypothetical protein